MRIYFVILLCFFCVLCTGGHGVGLVTEVHAAQKPKAAKRWTVVIDPGHGGADPGTGHNGLLERRLTLELGKSLSKELARRGVRVVLTRTRNATLSIEERVKLAQKARGHVLISLHINAHADKGIRGLEVWHWQPQKGEKRVPGAYLAGAVHSGIRKKFRLQRVAWRDGGLKSGNFGVLRDSTMPAVIVEAGYASNRKDARLLRRRDYQQAMVKGIADGIMQYLKSIRK